MFKNMKLATKMYCGLAVPLAILIAMGVFAGLQSQRVQRKAEFTQTESAVFASLASNMKLDVVQVQQWLTDISATRATEGFDDGFDEAEVHARSFRQGLGKFAAMFEEGNYEEGATQIRQLERTFGEFYEMGKKMARAYIEGGPPEGNKAMEEFDAYAEAMEQGIDKLVQEQNTELSESMQEIVAASVLLKKSVTYISIATFIFCVLTAWLITRSVTGPVNRIIAGLNEGSDQVNDDAAQAAGETTALIEDSVGKAREGTEVASEVGRALGAIVGDVSQVTELVNGIAQASEEQAQGVEQVNSAVAQMDKVTQQNASGAEESASAAEQLSAQAQQLRVMVDELANVVHGTRAGASSGPGQSARKTRKRVAGRSVHHESASEHARTPVSAAPSGQAADEFMKLEEDGDGLSEF